MSHYVGLGACVARLHRLLVLLASLERECELGAQCSLSVEEGLGLEELEDEGGDLFELLHIRHLLSRRRAPRARTSRAQTADRPRLVVSRRRRCVRDLFPIFPIIHSHL